LTNVPYILPYRGGGSRRTELGGDGQFGGCSALNSGVRLHSSHPFPRFRRNCQSARKRNPGSACKRGSDSILMKLRPPAGVGFTKHSTISQIVTLPASKWNRARGISYPYGTIVHLILTGQRLGEIAALRWDWIGEGTVTFPGEITKNARASRIPLGTMAQRIIEGTPRCSSLLFPARGQATRPFNGFGASKESLDKCSAGNRLTPGRYPWPRRIRSVGAKAPVVQASG
jgi:hypothetical protein